MPEPVVRDDLASARLVRLDLPEARDCFYPLQAVYRTDNPQVLPERGWSNAL